MTLNSKSDKPSTYTLGQVVDAARRNQRIDPQGAPAHFTLFFDKEIKDESKWFEESAVLELFNYASEKWGVNLQIVGGGTGCFRLMCRADDVERVAMMLISDEFRTLAKNAKIDKVWFESPHIVIDTSLDQDKAPPAVDFAILTPLLSEFKAVQRSLNEVSLGPVLEYPDGAFTYFKYEVPTPSGKNLRVIATFMTKMGNDIAALATFNLLEKWRPKYLLLVGIAGALDKNVRLGDVIIGDEVMRYDRRRKESENETQWAPVTYTCDRELFSRARSLILSDDLMDEWKMRRRVDSDGVPAPSAHPANLACGDAVVDSEVHKADIARINRTCVAVEMEAGGCMEAALTHSSRAPMLVVRGISDRAAGKSDTDGDAEINWRDYAANNAASFGVMFIRNFAPKNRKPTEVRLASDVLADTSDEGERPAIKSNMVDKTDLCSRSLPEIDDNGSLNTPRPIKPKAGSGIPSGPASTPE